MKLIEKSILLNPYISTATYRDESGVTRSYVVNEKLLSEFLFEDIVSDLWNVILRCNKSKDIITTSDELLEKFIRDNKLEDEIDEFLDELSYADLISYGDVDDIFDDVLLSDAKMQLYNDKEELDQFALEKKTWLYKNKFLYSLTFKYNDKNFDIDLSKKIVDDAQKIGVNLIVIDMRNSEVTEDFIAFAEYVREKLLSLELLLDVQKIADSDPYLRKIIRLYPHRVKLPLYSTDASVHDSVTQTGNYDKTIKMIEMFSAENVPVNVCYEQKEENAGAFEKVLEYTNLTGVEISYDDKNIKTSLPVLNSVNDNYLDCTNTADDNFYGRQKLYVSDDYDLYMGLHFDTKVASLKEYTICDCWKNIIKKKEFNLC